MQNRINKYARLSICLLLLSAAGAYTAKAQDRQATYRAYLQAFKKKISDAAISYKYTFSFFSESGRNDMMEVKGRLYKVGNAYLDSNLTGITLLSSGYFLKIRNREKDAYVYSISSLEKNMGIKDFGSMSRVAAIPDSLLLKEGTFTSNDEANGVMGLTYSYAGTKSPLQEISMKIRKADTALLELKIILKEGGYRKRMTLYDFENDFDARILSTAKYFIGPKTLTRVAKHLEQFGYKAENSVMLERMKKIAEKQMKATEVDINFAKHELRESELQAQNMKNGMNREAAQQAAYEATLKEQGMYERGYERKLYTQEALDAGNKQLYNEQN